MACDDQNFVAEADSVICCCAASSSYLLKNGIQGYTLDVAAAIAFMMLQATDLGLGSCWIGAFNETKVKKLLRIPDQVPVVSLLTIGYPHYVPPPKGRKEISEIVAVENYNEPYQ
jgi:nitroreductase